MQILFRVGHSLTLQTEKLLTVTQCFIINIILGCVSLKKSKIGFLIRDHADSLFLKTRKIRKWIFFSISRNDPSMQFACFGGSFQNGGKFWFDV